MASRWCLVCCTRHEQGRRDCPGELRATGPERHGWRVNIETERGIDACGVLVAPSYDLWRARILTYPNILWKVPGGDGTLKFVADTPRDAERQAIEFIREHVRSRGYAMRDELAVVTPGGFEPETVVNGLATPSRPAAERKIRFLPIRYGVARITSVAGTGNLSETGLFIVTNLPEDKGTWLNIAVELDDQRVNLKGLVRWRNTEPVAGRSPGMGIQLQAPPADYVSYVRALA